MLRLTDIRLPLNHPEIAIKNAILKRINISEKDLVQFKIFKRGYDARKHNDIRLVYTIDIEAKNEKGILYKFRKNNQIKIKPDTQYKLVAKADPNVQERPIIIGTGPCGIFAGLVLAQMGFNPILLERGKKVKERTEDTFGFWRKGELNPESNVQFGEGGAGTFSDGKLHTQTKDKNNRGRKVLEEFVAAGAPNEILYISKPHIGTLKLVKIVKNMRNKIIDLGGEVRFQSRVDDLIIKDSQVLGVVLSNGEEILSKHVILAIGHSARDTFEMLLKKDINIEAKSFSIGLRIEHPQGLIDTCQFGENAGNPILGAADYKLVHHGSNGRSVYTFCMCPGGTVLASSSEPNSIVTNGMSQYSRNEGNANSAIVVEVSPKDFPGNPLAGIEFQRKWEKAAFILGGENYDAPGQLLGDFMANRPSKNFGDVMPSYKPGVKLGSLDSCLPDYVLTSIREALPFFNKKIKGFLLDDAILTGVETRTSSPIRIIRDKSHQSISLKGLYPSGEGAGYAGGILSSAVDGIKAAEAVAFNILNLDIS